ncbi:MAG: non-canonical purine NTP pyrophosphatase [Nanoarchaeota archaeon]|nr:non-canonical purine NTP pyrophosphatase [Nanoarchaeota archaeon]
MTLKFITGNPNKFREAKQILGNVEKIAMELPEIQEINAKKIIEYKLQEAMKTQKGEFFCEDTSLYINSLNGLPGPLIKWFLESMKTEGIYRMASFSSDRSATAKTIIGYTNRNEIRYFEGKIDGEIVAPKGETNFGWDPIFLPKGYMKTFAQMTPEEKNEISMRKKALTKLKDYLESRK